MPEWRTGADLLKRCNIQSFDLLTKYIKGKGLQPYNYAEQPLSPADAMAEVLDGKLATADHTSDSYQCDDYNENEAEVLIFHIPRSKFDEIRNTTTLKNLNGVSWCDFELPDNHSEATHLLFLLKQALYLADEVEKFCPPADIPPTKENNPLPEQLDRKGITWVTLKQLAEATNISIYKLRNYIRNDGMPHKGKKKFLVNPNEFERWFSNFEGAPTNAPKISLDDMLDEALK